MSVKIQKCKNKLIIYIYTCTFIYFFINLCLSLLVGSYKNPEYEILTPKHLISCSFTMQRIARTTEIRFNEFGFYSCNFYRNAHFLHFFLQQSHQHISLSNANFISNSNFGFIL